MVLDGLGKSHSFLAVTKTSNRGVLIVYCYHRHLKKGVVFRICLQIPRLQRVDFLWDDLTVSPLISLRKGLWGYLHAQKKTFGYRNRDYTRDVRSTDCVHTFTLDARTTATTVIESAARHTYLVDDLTCQGPKNERYQITCFVHCLLCTHCIRHSLPCCSGHSQIFRPCSLFSLQVVARPFR